MWKLFWEEITTRPVSYTHLNEWYPQRGPRKMGRMSAVIKSPQRWTAETPYLYKLEMCIRDRCTVFIHVMNIFRHGICTIRLVRNHYLKLLIVQIDVYKRQGMGLLG